MNSDDKSPERVAWVAGLFDGEGTVTFHYRPKKGRGQVPQPRCVIRMTHEETLNTAYRILHNNSIGAHLEMYDGKYLQENNRKACWVLTVTGYLRTRSLMELLLPHLVTKREQALTVLAFVYSRQMRLTGSSRDDTHLNTEEASLLEHLRKLNAKGRQIPNEHTSDSMNVEKMCSELYREMQRRVEIYARLREQAKELRDQGLTWEQISEKIGVKKHTVYYWFYERKSK